VIYFRAERLVFETGTIVEVLHVGESVWFVETGTIGEVIYFGESVVF
jgi:hypothetical protein